MGSDTVAPVDGEVVEPAADDDKIDWQVDVIMERLKGRGFDTRVSGTTACH